MFKPPKKKPYFLQLWYSLVFYVSSFLFLSLGVETSKGQVSENLETGQYRLTKLITGFKKKHLHKVFIIYDTKLRVMAQRKGMKSSMFIS